MRTRQAAHSGFTLLELMLVITVAAVIMGIAIPNFREFLWNNRISGAANDVVTAIHLARSQAIKLHMPIVTCFTSTPDAATPACDGDGSQGWIVFADDQDPAVVAASDNNGAVDAGERVFLRHGPANTVTVNLLPAGSDYIAFSPTGFARPLGVLGVPISGVLLCDTRGNVERYGADNSAARGITVSAVGRPGVTRSVQLINDDLGGCP